MDPTQVLRMFFASAGRAVPSDDDIQSLSLAILRHFDPEVDHHDGEAGHDARVDGDPQLDSEMSDAPPDPSPSPSPSSSSSCINVAPLQGLPIEVQVAIFRHTTREDKRKLRLTCHSLGSAGLEELLVGRVLDKTTGKHVPKPPIQLHFGVRRHDLVILNALLAKPEISSRVQTLSLGCAYFDQDDLSADESARRYGSFHCGDDRKLGAGSNAVEWSHKDEIFELLDKTLELLQKLNRHRRTAEKVEDRKPDVSIAFGCTVLPRDQDTLPHGLRKLVRDHPTPRTLSDEEMDDISTDQSRFLDWALFVLFGAMHRRDKDSFQDKAISIDFKLRGSESTSLRTEMSLRVDLLNDGTLVNLVEPGAMMAINVSTAKAKTTVLKRELPPWNTGMDNKLRDLTKSFECIALHDLRYPTETNSLYYSDLVKLLEPRTTSSSYGPLFRVKNNEDVPYIWMASFPQLPFENIKRLELVRFSIRNASTIAAILARSKGLYDLRMSHGRIGDGSWEDVLKALTCGDGNLHYSTHIHVLQMEDLQEYVTDENATLRMRKRSKTRNVPVIWDGQRGYSDRVSLVDSVRDVRPGIQRLIREFRVERPDFGVLPYYKALVRVMFADVAET